MIRRTLIAALGAAALGLGGCGFTPLYAEGQAAAALAAIEVAVGDGRAGYLLREQLEDELSLEEGARPAYRLAVTVNQARDPRGLGPDNTASRYELRLVAAYVLTEIASGRQLTAGTEEVMVTYEAVDEPYAGIVAQNDGERRAAAEAARRIRLSLAVFFAKPVG